MLPRTLRLKNPLSFQKAFRFGKPFFFGNVGSRVLFRAGKGRKIGIVSAKKMFRLAVDRNRARRILSEAMLPVLDRFPEDAHIVVFFRSSPESIDILSVKDDMEGLIRTIARSGPPNKKI